MGALGLGPGPPSGLTAWRVDRIGQLRMGAAEPRGGLTLAARAALIDELEALSRNPDIYGAILEGAFDLEDAPAGLDAAPANELADAYQGLWRADRFAKPLVALMAGPIAWPAAAVAINGTHKVADPATVFAITEVARGRPPGWGASYHLPALPHSLGLYLTLTGATVDSALLYRLGWLTHRIPESQFATIKARLAAADPVDPLLDELDVGPGPSALDPYLGTIEGCFSAEGPRDIIARLDATNGPNADWARRTANTIWAMPMPTLEAIHRLLSRHAQPSLRDGLIQDFHIASGWPGAEPDLEAVKALAGQHPSGDLILASLSPPSIS